MTLKYHILSSDGDALIPGAGSLSNRCVSFDNSSREVAVRHRSGRFTPRGFCLKEREKVLGRRWILAFSFTKRLFHEASIWETRIETRIDSYQSLQEISKDDDDENEDEDDENKITIPPRKKPEREKRSRPPTPKSSDPIREILHDFFQQQKMIDMQWRQLMEKHAYERQLFEQEWRQSMERLKIERLKMDKLWREKEEQRRTREEVLRGWAGYDLGLGPKRRRNR